MTIMTKKKAATRSAAKVRSNGHRLSPKTQKIFDQILEERDEVFRRLAKL